MYVNGSICVSDPEHIAKLKSLRGCSSKCHLLPKQDSSKEKKAIVLHKTVLKKLEYKQGRKFRMEKMSHHVCKMLIVG